MRENTGFFVFFCGMALEAYFLPWLFVAQIVFFAAFVATQKLNELV